MKNNIIIIIIVIVSIKYISINQFKLMITIVKNCDRSDRIHSGERVIHGSTPGICTSHSHQSLFILSFLKPAVCDVHINDISYHLRKFSTYIRHKISDLNCC